MEGQVSVKCLFETFKHRLDIPGHRSLAWRAFRREGVQRPQEFPITEGFDLRVFSVTPKIRLWTSVPLPVTSSSTVRSAMRPRRPQCTQSAPEHFVRLRAQYRRVRWPIPRTRDAAFAPRRPRSKISPSYHSTSLSRCCSTRPRCCWQRRAHDRKRKAACTEAVEPRAATASASQAAAPAGPAGVSCRAGAPLTNV
jgi:hypothetical protein